MLAYFVDGYNKRHQLTPSYILVLFIVSVLAATWALVTLVRRESTRRSALFVAFVDLCFVGAFIAGAYELRGIASANCVSVSGGVSSQGGVTTGPDSVTLSPLTINYTPWSISANKSCAMLKASFAFAIMNCILFATTAVMALFLHRHERVYVKETVYRSRSHGSR
ncbi:MAG: hypothetical protein MMC23_002174 [Stictis urceolatum]|nr:hypothetical protein [Stictis urceolata]